MIFHEGINNRQIERRFRNSKTEMNRYTGQKKSQAPGLSQGCVVAYGLASMCIPLARVVDSPVQYQRVIRHSLPDSGLKIMQEMVPIK